LVLLPVVVGFLYVHQFGVNVVYRDEWEMVPRFWRLSLGRLTLEDLWVQHNQSRPFFPRVAILGLGTLTKWNNITEMYLILTCMSVTLGALYLAFKDSVGRRPLLFVPIAFLVFSLSQNRNMLFGYQLNFGFTEVFGVLSFYFLYVSGSGRRRLLAFAAALISGTIAAFSTIQGLLVWPVGLLQILIAPMDGRLKRLLAGVWGVVGIVEWIAYFIDYEGGRGSSLLPYSLSRPLASMEYFLTLFGRSLFPPPLQGLALSCGVLLTVLAAIGLLLALRCRQREVFSFWIALLGFSLLTLGAITAGRAGLGIESSLASRYTTFSLLAVVGIYAILAKSAFGERERSRLAVASFTVLCAVVMSTAPLSYYVGINAGIAERALRKEAAFILSTYKSQPPQRLNVLWKQSPQAIRARARALERLGYNVFADRHRGSPTKRLGQSVPLNPIMYLATRPFRESSIPYSPE
jgi:hypothetical protein